MTDACFLARGAQPLRKPTRCEECSCVSVCHMYDNYQLLLEQIKDFMIAADILPGSRRCCQVAGDAEVDGLAASSAADNVMGKRFVSGLLRKKTFFAERFLNRLEGTIKNLDWPRTSALIIIIME